MNKLYKTTLLVLFSVAPLCAMGAIKKINLPAWVTFDKHGYFSDTAGAKELFKRVVKINGALAKPISVKKMSKEAKVARFGTAQLFMVTCEDGKKYILKEIKGASEAKKEVGRLERVRKSKRLAPYIGPKVKNNLQIIVPLAYVAYRHKGKDHIFVIMRKAKGVSLQGLMEKFKSNPHDRTVQRILAKAYYDLGRALAHFHATHAPDNQGYCGPLYGTIVHNDMHSGNIFYFEDGKNGRITLIDNERMASSLEKNRDISGDLGCLFVTSPFVMEWSCSGFLKDFDAKKWYSIVVPSFILGYIRMWPKDTRADVFIALKDHILSWDSKVNKDESRHIRGLIKEQLYLLERQLVKEHKTALHVVARYPAMAPVLNRMLFVEKTKAIKDKDRDGNRALHEAAYFGNSENVSLLIKAGSPVNPKNDAGETPIFKACYNRDKDSSRYNKVIGKLKEHGAY